MKIKLNVRESQIIQLLMGGATNKEMASQLKISDETLRHYMTGLMQKLSAGNRTEAVLAAQKRIPSTTIANEFHLIAAASSLDGANTLQDVNVAKFD